MQVRTRSLVAAAVVLLAGCGGGDGKASVPTVTFAGGSSASGVPTSAGGATTTASTAGATPAATTTTVAITTSSAPTPAPTVAATDATTTLTTGSLASLPPGYTDTPIKNADEATVRAILQGYAAWLDALRVVGGTPASPPWDRLQATATAAAYPTLRKTFEDIFAQGHSFVTLDAGVSRAKVTSVLGPTVATIDDCQTEWSYQVDTATGTPLPGQEAAVAAPTNTGYHVDMVLEGGTWRMSGYDATRSSLCAGI